MEAITPKQKLVYDYIHQFEAEQGFAPSQNEIATHFGFKSLGTVQDYLNRLSRAGFILRPKYGTRAARAAPSRAWPATKPTQATVSTGHSVNEGISEPTFEHGVQFRQTDRAQNGDLVLVTVKGSLAVKRLFRQRGRIELHSPESNTHAPLVNVDFTLHGVIVGVEP